jgi:hypothetical protein
MSLIEMINTYWRSRGYNVHAHMGPVKDAKGVAHNGVVSDLVLGLPPNCTDETLEQLQVEHRLQHQKLPA